ncbi:MAG: hypothetical protein ACP5JR_07460 [Thermoplasmata archaeon]
MSTKKSGKEVEAKKYEDVEYRISQKIDHCKMELLWHEGALYFTLSEIMFSHGDQYYVIPIKEIEHLTVLSEKPIKIALEFGGIELVFTGEAGHKLGALRHLLLPYIKHKCETDKMKLLLLYWAMGLRDIKQLSASIGTGVEECDMLLAEAKDRKYISTKGEITPAGAALFSPEEREKLDLLLKNSKKVKEGSAENE